MAVPNWRVEIVKQLGSEQWSNDYLTDDATIEDAQDLGQVLLSFERSIHQDMVQFTYIRVSSYVAGDRTFRHLDVNLGGQAGTFEYLPLFNTMRLNLATADSDPARKYYRLPIAEANQSNGTVAPAYVAALAALVASGLVATDALEHIVTPKGNRVISATWYTQVQMRQLHRRRRKKTTP